MTKNEQRAIALAWADGENVHEHARFIAALLRETECKLDKSEESARNANFWRKQESKKLLELLDMVESLKNGYGGDITPISTEGIHALMQKVAAIQGEGVE